MPPETGPTVQECWTQVLACGTAATEAFFERLLDLDPQLGRLFRGSDMNERGRRLTRAINRVVRGSPGGPPERPISPEEVWENPHLAVIASALFAMLERGGGATLTAAARAAWIDLFARHATEIRTATLGECGSSRVVPLNHSRYTWLGG